MSSHEPKAPSRKSRVQRVAEPLWEDALRAGQKIDQGSGSLDRELAIVNLLRHAAQPARLDDEASDVVWDEIRSEIAPAPWWRGSVRVWFGAALAAGAAAALLVWWPKGDVRLDSAAELAAVTEPNDAALAAEALERQFAMLAPGARRALDESVDEGRGAIRGELLALAQDTGQAAGGAP